MIEYTILIWLGIVLSVMWFFGTAFLGWCAYHPFDRHKVSIFGFFCAGLLIEIVLMIAILILGSIYLVISLFGSALFLL